MGDTNRPPRDVATPQDFATALTGVRHRAGLSIRKLSSMTGIPSATLGGYFSGRHLPSVSQGSAFEDLLAALGVTDHASVEAWFETVRRLRSRPADRAGTERAERPPNPYRGLRSFTEEEADRFFGREGYVAEVLALIERETDPAAGGMVALVGPSGSGKSSLLRGGVVPGLRARGLAAAVVVPGPSPLEALEQALAEPVGFPGDLGKPTRPDVLVIDQFEELFGAGAEEPARHRFLDRLAELTTPTADPDRTPDPDRTAEPGRAGPRRTVVVLGIRADFYGQVLREPVLLAALQRAQVLLGPMTEVELRRAVVEPARLVGVTVEDELVDLLLRDLAPRGRSDGAHLPGALPLLSHALMTAWERHEDGRLTVGDYVATGGIVGAVQASAEEAYTGLSPAGQAVARNLFSRLVNVDEEGVLTRRRARHEDLRHLAGTPGRDTETRDDLLDVVLERFIAARLLAATDTTVEISHEALLDAWSRLREWIAADRDALRVRRRVTSMATLWVDHGRDRGSLLRGAPLAAAVELLDRERAQGRVLLTPAERRFVELSRDQEGKEVRAHQRRSRRLAQLLAVASVLAVLAAVLAAYALDSRSEARQQRALADDARDAALSRQVATHADRLLDAEPILAKELAVVAYDIAETVKARSSLLDAAATRQGTRLVGPDGSMHAAATPDGSLLALAGSDGRVRLMRRDDDGAWARLSLLTADPGGDLLFAGAFSPDATLYAVGGIAGNIAVYDVSDPTRPDRVASLDEPASAVHALAFSPDGRALAAATSDPAVHRWSVEGEAFTPLAPIADFPGQVHAVAWARGGLLATASVGGGVRLWDAAGRVAREVAAVPAGGVDNEVLSVAFDPDGRTLAAGAKDKAVRLWDVTRPGRPVALTAPAFRFGSYVNAVAFSSDGSRLAAGGADGQVLVWDVDGGAPTEQARIPVPANVTGVCFTDDGRTVLTGALDGTARLWSAEAPGVGGLGDNVWSVGFDDAGTTLLVGPGTSDGALHLYDARPAGAPVPRTVLRAPEEAGVLDGAAAISPDGSLVAGGTSTGRVVVWRADGGRWARAHVLAPSEQLIESVAFSDDGRRLASVGDDGNVVVWDTADLAGEPVARVAVETIPLGVALSPDGSLLAVGGADNLVHLWRLSESGPEDLDPLEGFENYAIGLAFHPGGRLLAAGSSDATVRIWDLADPAAPEPLGPQILGPTDAVYSLAWNPTGDRLAGASTDGSVWLWDLREPSRPERFATLLGLGTDAYSVTFTPDGQRVLAGGAGGVVQAWGTDPVTAREEICATAGTPVLRSEWSVYVEGLLPRSVCD